MSNRAAPADQRALLEAAYAAHARELTAFAAGLVGHDDAADVVATTMARVIAAGRWHRVEQPRAYLYQAVYREAISVRRQVGRRKRLGARLEQRSVADSARIPDPEPADPAVAEAIRSLPTRQRAVVILTYWQDLHPDEVALRLGISPGAVKKHLARARATLRGALA